MKFADNIIRDQHELVFIKASYFEIRNRNIENAMTTELIKHISFDKNTGTKVYFLKAEARFLKIGENIYDEKQKFLTYRSS